MHQTSLYYATFRSRETFFGQSYNSGTHNETSNAGGFLYTRNDTQDAQQIWRTYAEHYAPSDKRTDAKLNAKIESVTRLSSSRLAPRLGLIALDFIISDSLQLLYSHSQFASINIIWS